jgi:hypothetical protein
MRWSHERLFDRSVRLLPATPANLGKLSVAIRSHRQYLKQMAVRILEVEPPPAAAMVDLHVAG